MGLSNLIARTRPPSPERQGLMHMLRKACCAPTKKSLTWKGSQGVVSDKRFTRLQAKNGEFRLLNSSVKILIHTGMGMRVGNVFKVHCLATSAGRTTGGSITWPKAD